MWWAWQWLFVMAVSLLLRRLPRVKTVPFRAVVCSSSTSSTGEITHTGQIWTEEDHRNARFIDRTKQVNHQFAINLVAEEPVISIDDNHTWCDGGNEALGHPKVYINLDKPDEVGVCGYCGKRFQSKKHL